MSLLREFAAQLTDEERHSILISYEKFERDGQIGDEPVRTYARKFMDTYLPGAGVGIVTFMRDLAFECYRYYSWEFRDEIIKRMNNERL